MLSDDPNLDTAERCVDDWKAAIEQRAAQARAISQRVARLTATARSSDGLVEVTVGSSGVMTALRLDEPIRGQSAARTAEEILATARAAQADLTGQVRRVAAETVGTESETGRAIVASFADRLATADGRGDAAR